MALPDPIRDPQFYQGVPLRRFAAFLIDTVAVLILMAGIALIGILLGAVTFGIGFAVIIPGFVIAGFAYRFTLLRERSATLGMMVLGIELRRADGERLDTMAAAIHTLTFYATLYVPILMIVGMIMMTLNPRRQLLHDLPLGTVMINRPV